MRFICEKMQYLIMLIIVGNLFTTCYLKSTSSKEENITLSAKNNTNDSKLIEPSIKKDDAKESEKDEKSVLEEMGEIISETQGGIPLVGSDDGKFKHFIDLIDTQGMRVYPNKYTEIGQIPRPQNIKIVIISISILLVTALFLSFIEFRITQVKRDPFKFISSQFNSNNNNINHNEKYYLLDEC